MSPIPGAEQTMTTTGQALAAGAAAFLLAATATAAAEDTPTFEQGRTLFETNCAQCHQESGEGIPPHFPALRDNDNLADHALIVARLRAGKEAMPAFPDFTVEDIAAVATYVRSAWTNAYGAVGVAQVEEAVAMVEAPRFERTIWDGVFTARQARDARLLYLGGCAPCHGSRLNGAPDEADMGSGPPLAGTTFLRDWNGRTLASLFEVARTTMPVRNPGQFTDQQYADILAYMLSYGEAPAGNETLAPDLGALSEIVITAQPQPDATPRID
jgi:mono/diheme cytochrome c family protein